MPPDRTELYGHTLFPQLLSQSLNRLLDNQTKVKTAILRILGRRQKLRRFLMDIDLRSPEEQGIPSIFLRHAHIEHITVKMKAFPKILRRQDKMVQ